jgi:Rnl2 family RNA ligase
MWAFTSYEKIAESATGWNLDASGERSLSKLQWVVTEKIHGANFCFVTDGQVIRCANRKKFLEVGDSFFSYQTLLGSLGEKVKQIFGVIKGKYPKTSYIFIYGELFGGCYPHPEVIADNAVQAIQTGVYYSPTINFCAFDIAIENIDENLGKNFDSNLDHQREIRNYLDYGEVVEILEGVNIFYAKPLLIGSYHQALNFSIGFESTIPQQLNLPAIEGNKAEGVVIKPIKSIYIDTPKGKIRPILKIKIPEFNEDKRFSQAEKWVEEKGNNSLSEVDKLDLLKWEAFNLITENRLQNAISKIGPFNSRELFNLFVEDVMEELKENQGHLLLELTEDDRKRLLQFVYQEARKIVKIFFKH